MKHRDTILVVDDDRDACEALAGLLDESGYSVEAVGDGARAVTHLEQRVVDLVLTDLQMPHMNGLELIGRIHALLPHLPVILITGGETRGLCTGAERYGAVDCLAKPINIDELLWAIERALALHGSPGTGLASAP